MKALIDADIFQFEFGSATDDEYKPLAWPLVQSRIQGRINSILEATGADDYQLYITNDQKDNFRYHVATIVPYKGKRPSEKPYWYTHIRNFLVDHRGAIEVWGMEADDALSIAQWKDWNSILEPECESPEAFGTVICSRDKDLHMVPGWHYSWSAGNQQEKEMWWVDEISGLRSFYCQLLTGDRIDNILGLHGVGDKSKLLTNIRSMDTELDMFSFVKEEYTKRFGSYAERFLLENGRLLWMLREEGEMWEFPTDAA